MTVAEQAYRQYYRGRRSFHGGPMNAAGVQLGYVRMSGNTPGQKDDARLVWQVPFGSENVRVDAETGRTEVLALK